MAELFVMRRANGEFLTAEMDGVKYLPVWPNAFMLEKYKVFNPALDLFLPRSVDERIWARLREFERSGHQFLLMSAEEPAPDLSDGRRVTLPELEEFRRPAA